MRVLSGSSVAAQAGMRLCLATITAALAIASIAPGEAQALPLRKQVAALKERAVSTVLNLRAARHERKLAPLVEKARVALAPHGLVTDTPMTVQSPLRRDALAAMVREYRLLDGATPGSWASRRRERLAPNLGSKAALDRWYLLPHHADGVMFPEETPSGWVAKHVLIGARPRYENVVNVVAHEHKHAQEEPQLGSVWNRVKAIAAETEVLARKRTTPARAARIQANEIEMARLEALLQPVAMEARAYEVGAFAQGLLGLRLDAQHLAGRATEGVYDPKVIGPVALRGYFRGLQRNLEAHPGFAELAPEARAKVLRRFSEYRRGYTDYAMRLNEPYPEAQPSVGRPGVWSRLLDWAFEARMSLGRTITAIPRRFEKLDSASAAFDAGERDAFQDVSPATRIRQLLGSIR